MSAHKQNVVLAHSPFLGPASLRPLADQLAVSGLSVLVPDLRGAMFSEPVHRHLAAAFATAVDSAGVQAPLVLVGHSGAGPLLPALARAVDRDVAGLVFLDAGLPTPGLSWNDTAPTELVTELRALARDSRLPPWHRWFDPDPLVELVPDPAVRDLLASEQPEVPVAFFEERRPDADWSGLAGYLQLSVAYATEAAQAAELGWPVRHLATHHLAPVTEPAAVAHALILLLTALTT